MNKIKNFILIVGIAIGISLMTPVATHAASVIADQCKGVTDSSICNNQDADANGIVNTIVNLLLYIIGAISVVMIIVGGLLYTLSAGDSGKVTTAKNTILYAVIGLVVAFVAYAVVNWVVKQFIK